MSLCAFNNNGGAPTDIGQFGVDGVAQEVTQVVSMPSAAVMDQIIQALS